jgi:hypothetical protein
VLLFVFLIFPRLKLLAMCTASITSLAINIALPRRIISTKQTDLLSRILSKAFNL